jgi:hypothetical protein
MGMGLARMVSAGNLGDPSYDEIGGQMSLLHPSGKSKGALIQAKAYKKEADANAKAAKTMAKIAKDEHKAEKKAAMASATPVSATLPDGSLRQRVAARAEGIAARAEAAQAHAQARLDGPQAPALAPTPVVDVADQLVKLADLRDKGVLTDEEFNAQKAKLLNS